MKIISVVVEFASGMDITDGASFDPDSMTVYLSERLRRLLLESDTTEAPPRITAQVDDAHLPVTSLDGQFIVRASAAEPAPRSLLSFRRFGHAWSKEQRQQFGRFSHTLSAASIVGAVGYWHSTGTWTISAVLNEAVLVFLFVILFLRGMDSMNGE
ncbi:hypothetical protein [Paraburkholderia kururiensis]|uniref:hypothetical protein n=1 Tax=Paraburkholderia kururiensis TaxID=984307 RepID=UPI000F87F8F0|nr:hypothetical protein [Paraburkholderia kururiensis]